MKWLEEFGCDTSGVKCVNIAVEEGVGNFFRIFACQKCCRFRCKKYFDSQSACNCGNRMEFYFTLGTFIALLRCPIEELKLIDIRVVISSACHKCGAKGDLYRLNFHTIRCAKCLIGNDQKHCWRTTCSLENWFVKTMDQFTSIKVTVTGLRKTKLRIKMVCPKCTNGEDYHFVTSRLLECKNCDTSWIVKCNCMYVFWLILVDILSFSKNQQIFLTYSKWMDAFSCSKCRNEGHETLMKSFFVEDVPLHTLFKKNVPKSTTASISLGQFLLEEASGKNSSSTASPSNNYPQLLRPRPRIKPSKEMLERAGVSLLESRKVVHPTLSSLDTRDPTNYGNISTMGASEKPNELTMLKCKCGRVDDLKDMFYCRTCSEHGICSLCVLRKHKIHQTEEAMNWSIMGIVGKHSEKNLKKIHAWAEEYRQVNSESKENYRQLCELLGAVYKRASTCGDIERCGEILSKCDITRVDYRIKHLLHSMKKSNDEIKEFRTMLENI